MNPKKPNEVPKYGKSHSISSSTITVNGVQVDPTEYFNDPNSPFSKPPWTGPDGLLSKMPFLTGGNFTGMSSFTNIPGTTTFTTTTNGNQTKSGQMEMIKNNNNRKNAEDDDEDDEDEDEPKVVGKNPTPARRVPAKKVVKKAAKKAVPKKPVKKASSDDKIEKTAPKPKAVPAVPRALKHRGRPPPSNTSAKK